METATLGTVTIESKEIIMWYQVVHVLYGSSALFCIRTFDTRILRTRYFSMYYVQVLSLVQELSYNTYAMITSFLIVTNFVVPRYVVIMCDYFFYEMTMIATPWRMVKTKIN